MKLLGNKVAVDVISKVSPSQKRGLCVPYDWWLRKKRRRDLETEAHSGEGDVMTGAETGAMRLHAKEC